MPTNNKGFFIGIFVFTIVLFVGLFGLIPQSLEALNGEEFLIKDQNRFMGSIYVTYDNLVGN